MESRHLKMYLGLRFNDWSEEMCTCNRSNPVNRFSEIISSSMSGVFYKTTSEWKKKHTNPRTGLIIARCFLSLDFKILLQYAQTKTHKYTHKWHLVCVAPAKKDQQQRKNESRKGKLSVAMVYHIIITMMIIFMWFEELILVLRLELSFVFSYVGHCLQLSPSLWHIY